MMEKYKLPAREDMDFGSKYKRNAKQVHKTNLETLYESFTEEQLNSSQQVDSKSMTQRNGAFSPAKMWNALKKSHMKSEEKVNQFLQDY